MRPGSFQCLFFEGQPLNDVACNVLMYFAGELAKDGSRVLRFDTGHYQGEVRTNYDTVVLMPLSGIRFNGFIECEHGSTEVTFLVTDPKNIVWGGVWALADVSSLGRPTTICNN